MFTPAPASAEEINRYIVDTGPLRIRDQFLLGMGFLAFDPMSADVQQKGGWQVDVITTVTNTFAHSDVVELELEERAQRQPLTLDKLRAIDAEQSGNGIFHLDGELYRTAFAVRRGLGKGVQVELVVPLLSFQGGTFDSTIEGFHDTFGLGQAGRTGVPKDDFLAYARSDSGEVFLDSDPGLVLGDVVVGGKFNLLKGSPARRFKLALETLVKLPTGDEDELSSSGSADFGAQVLLTRYFEKSCLHTSVGLLYLGEWQELGTPSQILPSLMGAYERSLGSTSSGLVQLTVSESPFRDLALDELAETSIQATLGIKPMTVRDLRRRLNTASAPEKARLLGKILREARDWEVWRFTTPDEVTRLWPRLAKHLGRRRSFWEFLLGEWRQQGRLAINASSPRPSEIAIS